MMAKTNKPSKPPRVQLDLHCPTFVKHWRALHEDERETAFESLHRLHQSTWDQVVKDPAVNWMQAVSIPAPVGQHAVFSLRLTRRVKAIVLREDDWMRFLVLQY